MLSRARHSLIPYLAICSTGHIQIGNMYRVMSGNTQSAG
jgi:hypothetical protein